MFKRLLRCGGTAVFLTAGLLALILVTGSATTRTTYEITDGELSYLVSGRIGHVETALESAGVTLSNRDLVTSSQEGDTVRVTVHRPVTTYEETFAESVPFQTIRQEDPDLPLGEERVVQAGSNGQLIDRVKVVTDPDGTVHRYPMGRFVDRVRVDEIIAYGTRVDAVPASWLSVSRDVLTNINADGNGGGVLTTATGERLRYSKELSCVATAYTTERQSWKRTATGTTARVGAIAVDPKVIPYGTRMYIVSADGSITYGIATAEDCGSGVKGNRIDLFFNTYNECINFGVQTCNVYILE